MPIYYVRKATRGEKTMSQVEIASLAALEAEFEKAVSDFNIVMRGKKIRPKQAAASVAHQAVADVLKRLETRPNFLLRSMQP